MLKELSLVCYGEPVTPQQIFHPQPTVWARSVLQTSLNRLGEITSAEQPPLLSSQKGPLLWVAA